MKRTVINATEGGAKIRGATQMPLKKYIDEYCIERIDKSVIVPLLTLADDAEKLIDRVVPLLQNDLDLLDAVIKNARKGLAVNAGLIRLLKRHHKKIKKIMDRKTRDEFDRISRESAKAAPGFYIASNQMFYDNVMKIIDNKILRALVLLSRKNFEFSEAAHAASVQNPLVNVAIYGASRRIQGRKLKADERLTTFLIDMKIALTRIERNNLILRTAKKASRSLSKSYRKTLSILKQYQETRDPDLLSPPLHETFDLADAEAYFAAGNWAHPLLDAQAIISDYTGTSLSSYSYNQYSQAKSVRAKALNARDDAISFAIKREEENGENEFKLLQYNDLIDQSREYGKVGKFKEALNVLEEACALLPDEIEARWGLATCLNHLERYEESAAVYRDLIDKSPGNRPLDPRLHFELGQVLLMSGDMKAGIEHIQKAMEATTEFNSFLKRIGQIYAHAKMYDDAANSFREYLALFPHDYNAWIELADVLESAGHTTEAKKAVRRAESIQSN